MDLQKMRDWFDSEEGEKSITEFADKINREEEIKNKQLERFHNLGNFEHFTEKVIAKYNSNKYRNYWYDRGIEPPEDLLWFLFYYAEKYGRECSKEEWNKYGNVFTSALFFCNGYYFNRMDGQGSVIQVIKQNYGIVNELQKVALHKTQIEELNLFLFCAVGDKNLNYD